MNDNNVHMSEAQNLKADMEKKTPLFLRSFTFSSYFFPAQFIDFSDKFGFLNLQIRNNFKKRKKRNALGLNILFILFCCNFTAVHEPSAKYYQLLGLHGRRWRKWRKIGI